MPRLPPVIFEDDALIAFDKPSGLLVAPDRWDKTRENLMGLVHAELGPQVANAHRIDAGTSGLVLCAKTPPALDSLVRQFEAKAVLKVYDALVVGGAALDAYTLDLQLGEHPAKPGRMKVVKTGGKDAVTEIRVLERFVRAGITHVECRPRTGRTHQIRVHLAANGTPVLNDPLYGTEAPLLLSSLKPHYKGREDERPLIARLALHAGSLTFSHPTGGEPVTLRAPLPPDFELALKYLRKFGRASSSAPLSRR